MKKFDVVLIVIALIILLLILPDGFMSGFGLGVFGVILKLIFAVFLGLFVIYWKFAPYKGSMNDTWSNIVTAGEKIFLPVLNFFDKFSGKIQLGPKLVTNVSPMLIISILIFLIMIM